MIIRENGLTLGDILDAIDDANLDTSDLDNLGDQAADIITDLQTSADDELSMLTQ